MCWLKRQRAKLALTLVPVRARWRSYDSRGEEGRPPRRPLLRWTCFWWNWLLIWPAFVRQRASTPRNFSRFIDPAPRYSAMGNPIVISKLTSSSAFSRRANYCRPNASGRGNYTNYIADLVLHNWDFTQQMMLSAISRYAAISSEVIYFCKVAIFRMRKKEYNCLFACGNRFRLSILTPMASCKTKE